MLEELRARGRQAEEAASTRLQQAVQAERSSYRDHIAKFDSDLSSARLELERVRASAAAAATHWEALLEDERRRRDTSASSYESVLVSLRSELADARLQLERSALSFEETKGAMQK
jgi:hypothetical protein